MNIMDTYPNLQNLLGGYFHQDWMEYGPNSESVLEQYLKDEWPPEDVSKALEELKSLLKLPDDELAKNIVDMGCEYYPIGLGFSYREWLTKLANQLYKNNVLEAQAKYHTAV